MKYNFNLPGNTEEGGTIDIETYPGKYRSFGPMYEATLMKEELPVRLASFSFKPFKGRAVTMGEWQFKRYEDFLYEIWKIWHANRVMVGHNIVRFDLPQCLAFFVEAGFRKPEDCILYDTYTISKKLKWPSHKLKYCLVASKVGYKIETGGEALWFGTEAGDPKCRRKFLQYNENDTVQTEKFFLFLLERGYVKLVFAKYYSKEHGCIRCGSHAVQSRGEKPYSDGIRKMHWCKHCNKHQPGELVDSWKLRP